jgi:uncharacterized protein (UPF0332 family)
MITPEIQHFLKRASESHAAAKVMLEKGFLGFSAAQSYYTMFYLVEALLLSKGMSFSSHSATIATFGKEFAKTRLLDPKFHRYLIEAQERREIGHYGGASQDVTKDEAAESYQWAGEFLQVVKTFLEKE